MNQNNEYAEYIKTVKEFLEVIILETKENHITWNIDIDVINKEDSFTLPKAFFTTYQNTEMFLQKKDSNYDFVVRFGKQTPFINITNYQNDEVNTAVARLFNLVYGNIPKARDYMNNFIKNFYSNIGKDK